MCIRDRTTGVSNPITDGCEPPCGCWELNSGPLEEQSVLLTSEPSLQLLLLILFVVVFRDRVSLCSLAVRELTL